MVEMPVVKCIIRGSSYPGAYVSATEKYSFASSEIPGSTREIIANALNVKPITMQFSPSLIGIYCKANSNGIVLSNQMPEKAFAALKEQLKDINVGVLESNLNAVGNNILTNDKIAIVNPDYSQRSTSRISDILGVEVIKSKIGGFKTVGSSNILTNKGLAINNRATDSEKEHLEGLVGFSSERTTANTGALSIGLSVVCNSYGIAVGPETTGFELARIMQAIDIS